MFLISLRKTLPEKLCLIPPLRCSGEVFIPFHLFLTLMVISFLHCQDDSDGCFHPIVSQGCHGVISPSTPSWLEPALLKVHPTKENT